MSFEHTGSQFQHISDDNIDPQLLYCNNQLPQGSQNDHAKPHAFVPPPSTQNFDRDVEQALQSQHDNTQWQGSLDSLPASPANLNTPRSFLNPLATPFRPQTLPETTSAITSSDTNRYGQLGAAQTFQQQPGWANQPQWTNMQPMPRQQWHNSFSPPDMQLPVRSHDYSEFSNPSTLRAGVEAAHQYQPTLAGAPHLQHTNLNALEQMSALATMGAGSQPAYSPQTAARMAMTSENMAQVPDVRDPFQVAQNWNQQTYHGPIGVPVLNQPPPTPASSSRRRRGGSVASTQTGILSWLCDMCSQRFPSKHKRNHHQRCHEKPFSCPICDEPFSFEKDVRRHVTAKHSKQERHLFCNIMGCPYRQKGFHRPDHLKRHKQKVHGVAPPSPAATSSMGGG